MRQLQICHFDLETYSEADLKKVGLYVYARHPSTDVLCASYRFGDSGPVHKWLRGQQAPAELMDHIQVKGRIKAHNCAFDAELWLCVLHEKYGWNWPGYDAFLDSQAQAQITGLPGKLELASRFFGDKEKSTSGYKHMLKMCKPRIQTKNLRDEKRHHTAEAITELSDYCDDDVRAESGFSSLLPELSKHEERVFRATWEMNRRGVAVDVPLVQRCKELAEQVQVYYRDKLSKLTQGDITTESQRQRIGKAMVEHGAVMPVTDAGNVCFNKQRRDEIIMDEADEHAHQLLDLYDTLNSSSISKYNKMLSCLCPDGRIRGMTRYSGAGQTGRWSGQDVQLQNLPRGVLEGADQYAFARDMIMSGCDAQDLETVYGSAMSVLASMIRPCLVAAPGKKLVCADLSAIEGRILAWESGEEHILEAYRQGKRLYAVAAASIFGCSYDDVVAAKKAGNPMMDRVGKTADLSSGYGGSVGAFLNMGGKALGLSEARIKEIVYAWRDSHPATTRFWDQLGKAAMLAVENPGRCYRYRTVRFGYNGQHLKMQLPSGRCLWFRNARIGEKVWPDGRTSPSLQFFGLDDKNRIGWVDTYGGKLTAYATQATAREILAYSFVRGQEDMWPFIMTVHDELVAEVPEDGPGHTELCKLMCELPDWAAGLPVDAAGWSGQFYMKD